MKFLFFLNDTYYSNPNEIYNIIKKHKNKFKFEFKIENNSYKYLYYI